MGCGASTSAPPKYAVPAETAVRALKRVPAAELKQSYASSIKQAKKGEKQWDAFISHEASAKELVGKIRDDLATKKYRSPMQRKELTAQLQGVKDSSRVVILLTPAFFDNPTCCAEFCEAVYAGVEVLPVCVEGSTWSGMPFPALTDVPEVVTTEVGDLYPRDAAAAVFAHTIAVSLRPASSSRAACTIGSL